MEIFFWVLVGVILGRLNKNKVYIGYNETKYQNSDIGILLGGKS